MLETRNTVETVFLLALVGYPELFWLSMPAMMHIVLMVLTLIPLAVISLNKTVAISFPVKLDLASHNRKTSSETLRPAILSETPAHSAPVPKCR